MLKQGSTSSKQYNNIKGWSLAPKYKRKQDLSDAGIALAVVLRPSVWQRYIKASTNSYSVHAMVDIESCESSATINTRYIDVRFSVLRVVHQRTKEGKRRVL